MKNGYAQVSSDDQNLALQIDALMTASCRKILEDWRSGLTTDRPGLNNLLATIRRRISAVLANQNIRFAPQIICLLIIVSTILGCSSQAQGDLDLSTNDNSFSWGNYRIGMSLSEFENLPLPNVRNVPNQSNHATFIKRDAPHLRATLCSFDGADFQLAGCRVKARFIFMPCGRDGRLAHIDIGANQENGGRILEYLEKRLGSDQAPESKTHSQWKNGDNEIIVMQSSGYCRVDIFKEPEYEVFKCLQIRALEGPIQGEQPENIASFSDNSKVGFGPYRLGMSIEEFKGLPTPKSTGSNFCTLIPLVGNSHLYKTVALPQMSFAFDNWTMPIETCKPIRSPIFTFYRTDKGDRLISISARVPLNQLNRLASALTNRYGKAQDAQPVGYYQPDSVHYKWVLPGADIEIDNFGDEQSGTISYSKEPEQRNYSIVVANHRQAPPSQSEPVTDAQTTTTLEIGRQQSDGVQSLEDSQPNQTTSMEKVTPEVQSKQRGEATKAKEQAEANEASQSKEQEIAVRQRELVMLNKRIETNDAFIEHKLKEIRRLADLRRHQQNIDADPERERKWLEDCQADEESQTQLERESSDKMRQRVQKLNKELSDLRARETPTKTGNESQ